MNAQASLRARKLLAASDHPLRRAVGPLRLLAAVACVALAASGPANAMGAPSSTPSSIAAGTSSAPAAITAAPGGTATAQPGGSVGAATGAGALPGAPSHLTPLSGVLGRGKLFPAQARRTSGGTSTVAIVIAALGALLVLASGAWAAARRRAFEPHWWLALRHSVSEARFRVSGTWAEFSDWARLGR